MQFTAAQYYQAGLERMRQARSLYHGGEAFSLAIYCCGLAVESLLRAFRWTADTSFEGRHDLTELLRASRLLQIDDEFMRSRGLAEERIERSGRDLRAAVNEVIVLWHNNLRYASEASLKAHLKRIGRVQGVKGDPLKKCANEPVNAAQAVIDRGVTLWISRTGS